ncbi:MAG: hypothetical protein GY773_19545 [Actinomycetia bacterium]|nr:hypothetical protein [Actinomycetes bacterium]
MERPVADEPSLDEPSLDDDLAELMAISRRLATTTDSGERVSLLNRQRELRIRWATGHEIQSTERLREVEKALLAKLSVLLDRHFHIASTGNGSGDGGGLDPLATLQHNRWVDETHGRADLEEQLRDIRAELRRRETES